MRVAVIDMGTNSTRLLVAAVDGGSVDEIHRESRVTRLGRGVDTSGALSAEAVEDVCAAVGDYLEDAAGAGAELTVALATSAVRDASNGDAFLAELRERFALPARVLDGDEEAQLTYRGAGCGRAQRTRETLVLDIGGGSTELIVGSGAVPSFHASLQLGVVRHTERHIHSDPPAAAELEMLADDVGSTIGAALAEHPNVRAERGIAVAGTPTSLAAIELELDPYDPAAVEGHALSLESVQQLCSRLSAMSLADRRDVVGLHPDRAPTIVAGIIILIQAMRALGLDSIEVSEHDILYGAALEAAANGA